MSCGSTNVGRSQLVPQATKRKRQGTTAFCGNYRGYYADRHGDSSEDLRLEFLDRNWFSGKKCLDIGCNDGSFTRQIHLKFCCRYMLGIDIDVRLIGEAWDATPWPNPGVCCWKREDFATEAHEDDGYDTITAFSVCKWVHLLHGDSGILCFFSKVLRLLRPGGRFIFEPQDWSSYKKNKHTSSAAQVTFHELLLKPTEFRAVLLDKIGFESCVEVGQIETGSNGFRRITYVCSKASSPASPPTASSDMTRCSSVALNMQP